MAPHQWSAMEQPNTELYGLLHLPRDASDEDIKHAFRQWAQVYHPDKFQVEQMREMATAKFREIREAYNILSDPQKRQVYDIYGLDGIKSGMEVGERLRTREEIREEFERIQARQMEHRKMSRIQHSSSVLVNLVMEELAREKTSRRRREEESGFFLRIASQHAHSSVQVPVSKKDTVVLAGSLVVGAGGSGAGMATMLALKHACSSFSSWEVLALMGPRPMVTTQATRQLSSHTSGNVSMAYNHTEGTISLSESWTRQLTSKTSGTVGATIGNGLVSDISWQRSGEKVEVAADFKVGMGVFALSAQCSRKVSAVSSLRASAKLGSNGVELELTAQRKLSANSSAGFSCAVGLQGLVWKLRYTRGGFKFVVPIILSRQLELSKIAMATLVPPAIFMIIKVYVLKPRALQRKKHKALEKRRRTAVQVREALSAARSAQELLETVSKRNRQRQEAKGGLLVERAVYGALGRDGRPETHSQDDVGGGGGAAAPAEGKGDRSTADSAAKADSREGEERGAAAARDAGQESAPSPSSLDPGLAPSFVDVTIPLQYLVEEDSRLVLHEGISKAGLMGFCDPCPGEEKRLSIDFSFRGQRFQVIVGDFEGIVLPQERHKV